MPGTDPEVDELTLQFAGLTVSIRVSGSRAAATSLQSSAAASAPSSPAAPTISSGYSVVSEPASARVPIAGPPAQLEQWSFVLDLSTPAELGALELGPHWDLARGLSADRDWTAQARVGRAFRAGVGARAVLEGLHPLQPASPALPTLRNRFYVCVCEVHTLSRRLHHTELCYLLSLGRRAQRQTI